METKRHLGASGHNIRIKEPLPYDVRLARKSELNFIKLRYFSTNYGSPLVRKLGPTAYGALHRWRFYQFRKRNALFLVASDPELPEHLYGFVIAEIPFIHFTYVVPKLRRLGIASTLLHHTGLKPPFVCSHWSIPAEETEENNPGLLTKALL